MSYMFYALCVLILVLASFSQCNASEIEIKPLSPRVERLNSEIAVDNNLTLLTSQNISFKLNPEVYYWNTDKYYNIKYAGLQSVIANRLRAYHKQLFNKYIRDYYDNSNLTPNDLFRKYMDYGDLENDIDNGSWWKDVDILNKDQRETIIIGREHAIINYKELSLTTAGRIKVGAIRFQLNLPTRQRIIDDNLMISRKTTNLSGSFQTSEVRLMKRIKLQVKPRVSFRTTLDPHKIISNITLEARARIFADKFNNVPLMNISLIFKTDLDNRNYTLYGTIELLTF